MFGLGNALFSPNQFIINSYILISLVPSVLGVFLVILWLFLLPFDCYHILYHALALLHAVSLSSWVVLNCFCCFFFFLVLCCLFTTTLYPCQHGLVRHGQTWCSSLDYDFLDNEEIFLDGPVVLPKIAPFGFNSSCCVSV